MWDCGAVMVKPVELSQSLSEVCDQIWHNCDPNLNFFNNYQSSFKRQDIWSMAKLSNDENPSGQYVRWIHCQQSIQDWVAILSAWQNNQCPILLHHYFNQSNVDHYKLHLMHEKIPQHAAVGILTSGSTGIPKLVFLTFENLIASAKGVVDFFAISQRDQWNWQLPISHVGGLAIFIRAMLAGFTIHQGELQNNEIVSLVPAQLQKLIQTQLEDLKKLRLILLGGSALPLHLWDLASQASLPLSISYGMTEAASTIAASAITHCKPGQAKPGMTILGNCKIAFNESGNLTIHGSNVANHVVQSNDLGFIDKQGLLHISGRSDRIIISGGVNISLTAIEAALSELGFCQAIGVQDAKWGESAIVYLWPSKNSNLDQEHIKNLLSRHLPRPHWPQSIYDMSNIEQQGKFSQEQLTQWSQHKQAIFKLA